MSRAGCRIRLYRFLIVAYSSTSSSGALMHSLMADQTNLSSKLSVANGAVQSRMMSDSDDGPLALALCSLRFCSASQTHLAS